MRNINNKLRLRLLILSVALIGLIGASYAYFTTIVKGNDKAKGTYVYAGTMELKYDGTFTMPTNDLYPGKSAQTTFTVTNTGAVATSYEVDIIDVYNDLVDKEDMVYTITSDNGGGRLSETVVPTKNGTIIPAVAIGVGVTQTYTVTVTFKNTDKDQSANTGKSFSGKIQINGLEQSNYLAAQPLLNKINIKDPNYNVGNPYYSYKYSKEVKDFTTTLSASANSNITVGNSFSFDQETGKFNLIDTETGKTYDNSIINKYTCASSKSDCTKMYKVEEVDAIESDEIYFETIEEYLDTDYEQTSKVTVGTSYTFDAKTGKYTLINAEQNVIISEAYTNYYMCYDNTVTCSEISLLKRVEGTTVHDEEYHYADAYYRQTITKNYSTSFASSDNKVVGKDFTFDKKTGRYTLTDTVENVSYSNDYKNYYTCNSISKSCTTMYKILEVNDTKLTNTDRYTRTNSTNNYITKAEVYTREEDEVHGDSGIFITEDDLGPSYYYRGNVENNYVNFAGILWRIVRVNGDGTIRLITQNTVDSSVYNSIKTDEKYLGYTYQNDSGEQIDSELKKSLDEWYDAHLKGYDNIVNSTYCNDTSSREENKIIYYGTYDRMQNNSPSLKCNETDKTYGGKYNLKIGLLSADEVILAGYSLYTDSIYTNAFNYLYNTTTWSTMSPNRYSSSNSYVYSVFPKYLNTSTTTAKTYYRPVINLKSDTHILSGTGTENDPYIIDNIENEEASKLRFKVLANSDIKITNPSFANGEPRATQFKEVHETISDINYTSNSNMAVGKGYTFNNSTGQYVLTDTVKNVSYSNDYIGYYTLNNINTTSRTIYKILEVNGSTTTKAEKMTSEAIAFTQNSGMYKSTDSDGITYYYRGETANNYVSFANQLWRVVRINGDKTIRLITDDPIGESMFNSDSQYQAKKSGYTYDNDHICTKSNPCTTSTGTGSTIKTLLENWYDANLKDYDEKITLNSYCNDTSIYSQSGSTIKYNPSNSLFSKYSPNLICNDTTENYGGYYKLKIGLLSGDELMMAGFGTSNTYATTGYLYSSKPFWTMTPGTYNSIDSAYAVATEMIGYSSRLSTYRIFWMDGEAEVYPVINLNSNVTVASGNGTKNSPYVIE